MYNSSGNTVYRYQIIFEIKITLDYKRKTNKMSQIKQFSQIYSDTLKSSLFQILWNEYKTRKLSLINLKLHPQNSNNFYLRFLFLTAKTADSNYRSNDVSSFPFQNNKTDNCVKLLPKVRNKNFSLFSPHRESLECYISPCSLQDQMDWFCTNLW